MGRIFVRLRNAIASPIKNALDRRYAPRQQLAALEARLDSIHAAVDELNSLISRSTRSDDLVAVCREVDGVKRLATECARAIEILSQKEILLRRDLENVLPEGGSGR